MRIDLHGLTSEEATSTVLSALISFDTNSTEIELEIITGKGFGFLMTTTINLLDEEEREYKVFDGRVVVFKNWNNSENDFEFPNWMEEVLKK